MTPISVRWSLPADTVKEMVMSEPAIEWKDAAAHREPKWPLMGYAPGGYIGRCVKCEGRFVNMDKRAWHCLPCAIDGVNEALAEARDKTRAAEAENATLRAAFQIVATPQGER